MRSRSHRRLACLNLPVLPPLSLPNPADVQRPLRPCCAPSTWTLVALWRACACSTWPWSTPGRLLDGCWRGHGDGKPRVTPAPAGWRPAAVLGWWRLPGSGWHLEGRDGGAGSGGRQQPAFPRRMHWGLTGRGRSCLRAWLATSRCAAAASQACLHGAPLGMHFTMHLTQQTLALLMYAMLCCMACRTKYDVSEVRRPAGAMRRRRHVGVRGRNEASLIPSVTSCSLLQCRCNDGNGGKEHPSVLVETGDACAALLAPPSVRQMPPARPPDSSVPSANCALLSSHSLRSSRGW